MFCIGSATTAVAQNPLLLLLLLLGLAFGAYMHRAILQRTRCLGKLQTCKIRGALLCLWAGLAEYKVATEVQSEVNYFELARLLEQLKLAYLVSEWADESDSL